MKIRRGVIAWPGNGGVTRSAFAIEEGASPTPATLRHGGHHRPSCRLNAPLRGQTLHRARRSAARGITRGEFGHGVSGGGREAAVRRRWGLYRFVSTRWELTDIEVATQPNGAEEAEVFAIRGTVVQKSDSARLN